MPNRVISIAKNEIGYLEKASDSMLDDKTANAGRANYTKYGKAQGCNGQAWCGAFLDWVFIQAYGKDKAKQLLGGFSNYTPTMADYFKKINSFYTYIPKEGDVIFFTNGTRICHVGLVHKVGTRIYTIEGNTSAGNTLVPNGGGVASKSYPLDYAKIAGYGRPNYAGVLGSSVAAPNTAIDYETGKVYTTLVDLNIRQEPAGEKQKFECITQDAKKHSRFDDYGNAILKKGTRVDCLGVKKLIGSTWILIPSGWICAVSNEGKTYIQ